MLHPAQVPPPACWRVAGSGVHPARLSIAAWIECVRSIAVGFGARDNDHPLIQASPACGRPQPFWRRIRTQGVVRLVAMAG